MTRNKITLTWIANDSSRKAALKKRRAGLFKKTKELSVLADVKSCAVVYSPEEVNPAFFPSYEVVKGMFEKFMSMSMVERSQKMLTHEGYLRQRVIGEIEKRDREKRKNDKREAQEEMNKIFEGSDLRELDIGRLNKLSLLVVDKLKELEKREEGLLQLAAPPLSPPAPPPPPLPLPLPLPCETIGVEEYLGSSINPTWIQELMNDNWFMETMALYQQDIPCGPSWVLSDFGIMPSEHHAAGSVRAGERRGASGEPS
ncbi:agamous-like MADS-box protein AGL80 [Rhododendron vialii]|uniref:agamous-like MADS-box protein AGL80 n=1 Tax=Rhododendron vialii TaxID=182163 RepID=UPI00265F5CE3|nr:agamous-like MADS-box protein AGL80 [Rhododendron vialii]